MPPRSRAQARLMRAVASGSIKKPSLSRAKALEFVQDQPTRNLPERVKPAPKKKGR